MNEPIRPNNAGEQTASQSAPYHLHMPSPGIRILLLLLTVLCGTVSGLCPDLLSAAVFAFPAAGLFAYCFLLTFSPLVFAVPVVSAIAAFAAAGSFYNGLQALLFLPLGVSVCLSMLRTKDKTTAVLRGAVAVGIALVVLFLIAYMMAHGTIAPDALKQSYNAFFENLREQMNASMMAAYEAMEEAAASAGKVSQGFTHPVIDAPATEAVTEAVPDADAAKQSAAYAAYIRAMVDLSVNSVKLAMPALIAIWAQILAYGAIGIYQLLMRLCRTPHMLPRTYRITVSRAAAVVFIVAYLINLFPGSNSMSLVQIASANLTTMMIPGIFLMGIKSLVRRAKDPLRRRSFILTAVVLGFLVFVFPSYAIFFVLIDGIGEIFFGGRSIF